MRVEQLIESKPATLELSEVEAVALNKAGRRLASKKKWWGDSASELTERSVIQCRPVSGGKWQVTIQDAVGIVSVGHLHNHLCVPAIEPSLSLLLAVKEVFLLFSRVTLMHQLGSMGRYSPAEDYLQVDRPFQWRASFHCPLGFNLY